MSSLSIAQTNTTSSPSVFEPIKKLTVSDTDRRPIDMELVATVGADPARFASPRKTLRLRLERAYVDTLLWQEYPPDDAVYLAMGFDAQSGLPISLFKISIFKAPTPANQADRRSDNVPQLSLSQANERTILVELSSGRTVDQFWSRSKQLAGCKVTNATDELMLMNKDDSTACRSIPIAGKVDYVARFSSGELTHIS